ncbi:MAG: hypothetical protein WBD31_15600 [Rubripirellula sp.]
MPAPEPVVSQPATGSVLDFGQLDLPSASTSASTLSASTLPRSPVQRRGAASGPGFWPRMATWVNGHRWVTAIAVLNLMGLVGCVFFPPFLVVMAINIPIGLVIVGLLFVPRQYVVKRLVDSVGAQAISMGGGGGALMLLVVASKVMRGANKINNNPNIDQTAFSTPAGLAGIVGSLVAALALAVVAVVLWRYIGIARMMATGYCAMLLLAISTTMLGVAAGGAKPFARSPAMIPPAHMNTSRMNSRMGNDRQADFNRRLQEMHARDAQQMQERMAAVRARVAANSQMPTMPNYDFGGAEPSDEISRPPAISQPPSMGSDRSSSNRRLKRYLIDIPLPDDGVVVDSETPVTVGMNLRACYAGQWYGVTVVQVHDDGSVRVNWDDWKSFTYDMSRDDLVVTK